ncbi:NAD(P)/FAD-dependent oxidoreductase [Labrys wisconsinensis]|uniref:D-amino-acid dehydrogenase n=1 Tax=Labrys wisconsinensis TaxID=425677 RepID=A0ABU0JD37_9HYPH|nr:FAD-binding oxidoreductase [Labrys wisconsinensis]MDQ0472191.1 D-amino-acid dehydrogenase [Labrys wisconsinensis]
MTHVAVVGAGIVGVTTAYSLLRSGYAVTLVDPEEPGSARAASFGNGGWLSPSLVIPSAMPGLWKMIPGMLLDPRGPLTVDIRRLPRLMPWLTRFIWNGATEERVRPTSRALSRLVGSCPDRHRQIASEIGASHLIEPSGLLFLYRSRQAYAREALPWALRRELGARWIELDEGPLREVEPGTPDIYGFGALVEGGHCVDPGKFVAALGRFLVANGVVHRRGRALGFSFDGDRLTGIETEGGNIACDKAVVSAGAWSGTLAAALGDRVPLEAERGHHIVIPGPAPALRNRLLLTDRKITVRRVGDATKITGQVDFSGLEKPANPLRFQVLRDLAADAFPILGSAGSREMATWMGRRPSLPDGLPVIGRSTRSPDVVHAFGHGHVGFASAPETARLVTGIITGTARESDIAAYSPRRFR